MTRIWLVSPRELWSTNCEGGMTCANESTDTYSNRALTAVLILGGVIGLLDPLITEGSWIRSGIGFFAGVVLLCLVPYLRRSLAVRRTMFIAVFTASSVFLGDFALFGKPYFYGIGFAVPLGAALFMSVRDSSVILVGYCAIGLLIVVLIQSGFWQPPLTGSGPSVVQHYVNATLIIGAMSVVTIWKEQMFASARSRERRQQIRMETVCEGYGAIVEADKDGKITYVSGRFLEAVGYTSQQLLGSNHLDFIARDDRRTLLSGFAEADGQYRYDKEVRVVNKAGSEVWVRLSGGTYLDDWGNRTFISAIQDIHEQVAQRRDLYEYSRLESLGSVCGGLAHDFNNLLTVIGIQSELVQDKDVRKDLLNAQKQAADLTAGLLTFARKQEFRERNICLADFLRQAESLIHRMVPATIQCCWDCDEIDAIVRVDPSQLQQVLINLVTNAQHAMPDGGKLTVRAEITDVLPDSALCQKVGHGTYATLVVADTGIGMDEKTVQRAIEPFFTTKSRGKGTGLGLATVHGVVRRAGGAMSIESELGSGTSITIYLPIQTSATEEVDEIDSGLMFKPDGNFQKVLLIDDRESVSAALAQSLKNACYAVTVRNTAEAGWEKIQQDEFDLLISDVVLPGMSGVELARRVHEAQLGINVILISGHQQEHLDVMIDYPHTTRFLPKPFASKALLRTAAELLEANPVSPK